MKLPSPLAAAVLVLAALPARAAATAEDARFEALTQRYVAELTWRSPVSATQLGEHRYDDRLSDITAAGRSAREAQWEAMLAELGRLDRTRLSRDHQVDALLLANDLRSSLWADRELQDWAWNAQLYNDEAANSLYLLAARDFAPWPQRLKAATARMEAIPGFLAEMRRQLTPARVPPVYAQQVSKQNGGILEIAETMIAPHASELSGADRDRFDAALAGLRTAIAQQQTWLDSVLVPQAKGDFRLGARLYDQKMAFGLQSSLMRGELKARAVRAMSEIRREMYALSRKVLADRAGAPPLPAAPSEAQQQAAIEAALALTYAHHPARTELEQAARAAAEQATAFVRANGFVGMPDGPVKVVTMPKFQQGNAVAYDDAPGPLERNLANFFAVSPVPAEWTEAQANSFLAEYNDYMIQDLAIHEAMPGHYLQLDHANRDPSVVRAVLASSPFIEGWAVYAEGMMKDQGYLEADPLFQLTVLKMRLRSVSNTLLDIGIHTEGMTRDQAMALMMKGAFQQEREAAGKWIRASLSSVQLLSYFTGYEEHRALREEARAKWGKGFTLRRYNDAVLTHGSPPVKYARELLLDLQIE